MREVESATSHVTTWNDGFKRKDTTVTKVRCVDSSVEHGQLCPV